MIQPCTLPIGDGTWQWLAGAAEFANGDRPWFFQMHDHELYVCAALESVEVHSYAEELNTKVWAFAPAKNFTSLMGRCVAETIIATIESVGLDRAIEMLGLERME